MTTHIATHKYFFIVWRVTILVRQILFKEKCVIPWVPRTMCQIKCLSKREGDFQNIFLSTHMALPHFVYATTFRLTFLFAFPLWHWFSENGPKLVASASSGQCREIERFRFQTGTTESELLGREQYCGLNKPQKKKKKKQNCIRLRISIIKMITSRVN